MPTPDLAPGKGYAIVGWPLQILFGESWVGGTIVAGARVWG